MVIQKKAGLRGRGGEAKPPLSLGKLPKSRKVLALPVSKRPAGQAEKVAQDPFPGPAWHLPKAEQKCKPSAGTRRKWQGLLPVDAPPPPMPLPDHRLFHHPTLALPPWRRIPLLPPGLRPVPTRMRRNPLQTERRKHRSDGVLSQAWSPTPDSELCSVGVESNNPCCPGGLMQRI